jgi:hypothetical protein
MVLFYKLLLEALELGDRWIKIDALIALAAAPLGTDEIPRSSGAVCSQACFFAFASIPINEGFFYEPTAVAEKYGSVQKSLLRRAAVD